MKQVFSQSFTVDVTKDHLVFSAGHFITIEDWCERLHGHNYRVAAQVEGPLDQNGFVFDFIALRDELQRLCLLLDHRMLLPEYHDQIRLTLDHKEIEVRYQDRRWVFPRDECVVLPIQQTTAELLAHWMASEALKTLDTSSLEAITVKVEENFGQWASCRLKLQSSPEVL